ncbi:hypothetical protein QWJ34_24970 [Saccharibacillus sp. CPCC 101409]|uniref:hypothetical protein n=1 Tax=Saccharibacillus sp. CPCC 101409 TaxID=3058041 RepID=UPI002673D3B1|nr:hypothetical protein [Saccharibacillus sp. CPCC 101409]MDO3413040.1 hypothetical protein [Saccharibacillus sp. CPCC 101409]
MRITCYEEDGLGMGYIYLMPHSYKNGADDPDNEIGERVAAERMVIPYIDDTAAGTDAAAGLDRMIVAEPTLLNDYGIGYDTDFGNDLDANGYMIGIELRLDPDRFVKLIEEKAFRVIRTTWHGRAFNLVALGLPEDVFDERNVLYKMTEAEDVFVIVRLMTPAEFGVVYEPAPAPSYRLAEFRGLLSARDDLYPPAYLLEPEFILRTRF